MGTTATQCLGVEREATLFHVFFVKLRMATSDVGTPWMLDANGDTGGYDCGSNAVS